MCRLRWLTFLAHPVCLPYTLFISVHLFSRDFRLQFWVGLRTHNLSWGRWGCRGSEMVPFERAMVCSYRPSTVTFPLSLRVSEILLLLFFSTPGFPTPPQVGPKSTHVPLGVGGSPFRYKERRCWALRGNKKNSRQSITRHCSHTRHPSSTYQCVCKWP